MCSPANAAINPIHQHKTSGRAKKLSPGKNSIFLELLQTSFAKFTAFAHKNSGHISCKFYWNNRWRSINTTV